jgi:hypothetical protein
MIKDFLTNLVCVFLIKVVDLEHGIVTVLMQAVQTLITDTFRLFSFRNDVPEKVSTRGLTVGWPLFYKKRLGELEGQG